MQSVDCVTNLSVSQFNIRDAAGAFSKAAMIPGKG
jgi:hypothetical protein